jgi:hypothetical protein
LFVIDDRVILTKDYTLIQFNSPQDMDMFADRYRSYVTARDASATDPKAKKDKPLPPPFVDAID